MKIIKKTFCLSLIVLLSFALSIQSHALSLFYTDYDNDKWDIEEISFVLPDSIPKDWYPLKAVSEYLPTIYVGWDKINKQVEVYSDDLYWISLYEYDINNLPSEMVVVDGTTYCSPVFLASLLSNHGFYYDGEIYYFADESVNSELIDCRGDKRFKERLLTVLYQMKLMLPDVYDMVRNCLTGGIKLVYQDEVPYEFTYDVDRQKVVAYINSDVPFPVCKIVKCQYNMRKECLAGSIAHEAYHVYQYQLNGEFGEDWPTQYENDVYDAFVQFATYY